MPIINAFIETLTITEQSATILYERNVSCSTTTIAVSENQAYIAGRVLALTHAKELTSTAASINATRKFVNYWAPDIRVELVQATITRGRQVVANTSELAAVGQNATIDYPTIVAASATVDDEMSYELTFSITETFNVTNTIDDFPGIVETATWTDSFVGFDLQQSLTSTFYAKDAFELTFEQSVTEAATLTDTLTDSRTASFSETFTATEVVTPSGTATALLTDTATVTDDVPFAGLVLSIAEVANVSGTHTSAARDYTETVNEAADFSDLIVASWRIHTTSFTETATVTDTQTFGGTLSNLETSTFTASDKAWATDYGALAWVMNTETAGLSQYDNFAFDSLVEYDGVLYATSPNGIHAFDADKDDGRDITAYWKTGFQDFKADAKKRLSGIYVSHTGGELECSVETYDSREDTVYTYTIEERDAVAPRNNRIRVGKGLTSRYWRFTFSNVNGADFQVHDVAVEVGVSNRRL